MRTFLKTLLAVSVLAGMPFFVSAYTFTQNLTIGSTGTDVTELQTLLSQQGYFQHVVTGYFGPITQAALAVFQFEHSIVPSVGYFGPITRAVVNSFFTTSVPVTSTNTLGGVKKHHSGITISHSNSNTDTSEEDAEEPGDTTDPDIDNIDVTDITDESATFTWTTDEVADSQVEYGPTSSLGEESVLDTEATTTHTVILTGLDPNTQYFFSVRSADEAGNISTSNPAVFTTLTAEAQQFFDRLATEPDAEHKTAYNNLAEKLVYAGIWDKLDALYILAAENEDAAKTNIISSDFGLTEVGSTAFAVDEGYTGQNGAGTYLETGFDPTIGTPHFSRNDASLFAWRNTAPGDDVGAFAGMYPSTFLITDQDHHFYSAASGGFASPNNLSSLTGLFMATRPNATETRPALNGLLFQTVSANSSAPTAGKTMQFLNDGLGRNDGSNSQLSVGGFGSNFSGAETRNLYTSLYNYLADIHNTTPTLLAFSSDINTDGAGNYTPGIARLADGRILAVYAVGNSQVDGKIVYQTSDDDGRTWSSPADLALPPTGSTYTDPSVTVLSDGQILIPFMQEPNTFATSTVNLIKGVVEENSSFSWSAPINVPSELSVGPATSSYVLELQDGRLMLGLYIWPQAIVSVVFSSDDGDTWGDEVTVVDGLGDDFTESNYVQLQNGTILGVIRDDNGSTPALTGYYIVSSTDNGATWSAPTQIFDDTVAGAPARPALAIAPDNTIFLVSRFNGSASPHNATGFSYSFDNGETWSTPEIYYNVTTNSYGQHTYAQGFYDDITNTFMYILIQGGFTSAQVNFQQFDVPHE